MTCETERDVTLPWGWGRERNRTRTDTRKVTVTKRSDSKNSARDGPSIDQGDRGRSFNKKNVSLEQTTAEALQILKKSETQNLATGGKNVGDPNKLIVTFYGCTNGCNYVNGTSAFEFVNTLKTWGKNIQAVLKGTHSEEEIDEVRIKGLLSSLEEARTLIARNIYK